MRSEHKDCRLLIGCVNVKFSDLCDKMWYNIIPSFAVVTAFMGLPALCIVGINKLVYGNLYQRDLNSALDRHMVMRDERLTGSAFKTLGLENIPDEEQSE